MTALLLVAASRVAAAVAVEPTAPQLLEEQQQLQASLWQQWNQLPVCMLSGALQLAVCALC